MRKTLRLRWLVIFAALAACAAAQIVNPQENVASPRGPWIADRYGSSHVLTCFDVLDPRVPLPKGGVPFGPPSMNLCDRLQLTPDQMQAAQALDPAGEPFRMGEAYRLLLGGGVSITVQVSVLTAQQGDYLAADPSMNSYLGAVLTVPPQDLAKFRASPHKVFVLERMDAADALASAPPTFTAWAPPPPDIAAKLRLLLHASLLEVPPMTRGPLTPTFAVETIAAAGQRLYLARAVLPPPPDQGRRLNPVVYAWVEFEPEPHIVGKTAYGTVQGSEEMEQQSILNVVGLSAGQTAILFNDEGEYHWSHELLILSPDGSLKPAHAYGATSD